MPNGNDNQEEGGQIVPILLIGALSVGAFFLFTRQRGQPTQPMQPTPQPVQPTTPSVNIENIEFSRV